MAAISYDRYNVIVNGMNGTRMTTSKWSKFADSFRYKFLMSSFLNDRNSNIVYSVLLDLFDCVELYSVSWMGQIHS